MISILGKTWGFTILLSFYWHQLKCNKCDWPNTNISTDLKKPTYHLLYSLAVCNRYPLPCYLLSVIYIAPSHQQASLYVICYNYTDLLENRGYQQCNRYALINCVEHLLYPNQIAILDLGLKSIKMLLLNYTEKVL